MGGTSEPDPPVVNIWEERSVPEPTPDHNRKEGAMGTEKGKAMAPTVPEPSTEFHPPPEPLPIRDEAEVSRGLPNCLFQYRC